jgi:hypothetical protein
MVIVMDTNLLSALSTGSSSAMHRLHAAAAAMDAVHQHTLYVSRVCMSSCLSRTRMWTCHRIVLHGWRRLRARMEFRGTANCVRWLDTGTLYLVDFLTEIQSDLRHGCLESPRTMWVGP